MMVAPVLASYECGACCGAFLLPAWMGRCPDCLRINTLRAVEAIATPPQRTIGAIPPAPIVTVGDAAIDPAPPVRRLPPRRPVPTAVDDQLLDLGDCQGDPIPRMPTGHAAVDDHMRGGVPDRGAILVAGHSGAGKSRLFLEILARLADSGKRCLLASGEEQRDQLGARREELRLRERFPRAFEPGRLATYLTNDFEALIAKLRLGWDAALVDALSVMHWRQRGGVPGSVRQITAMATELHRCAWAAEDTRFAGGRPLAILAICHGLKDGNMAGPQAAKHIVDAAFMIDHTDEHGVPTGDPQRSTGYMRLGCLGKNRFGNATKERYLRMTPEPEGIVMPYDPPPRPEDPSA